MSGVWEAMYFGISTAEMVILVLLAVACGLLIWVWHRERSLRRAHLHMVKAYTSEERRLSDMIGQLSMALKARTVELGEHEKQRAEASGAKDLMLATVHEMEQLLAKRNEEQAELLDTLQRTQETLLQLELRVAHQEELLGRQLQQTTMQTVEPLTPLEMLPFMIDKEFESSFRRKRAKLHAYAPIEHDAVNA
jgi:uncharacterized membrane protein YccC